VNAYDKEIRLSGGLASVGKTVESFRMALESEISRWSSFAYALRKPDREAFDELMDMCRTCASESSCATNPIVFEPMVMSIMLAQQKKLRELEYKLNELLWQRSGEVSKHG
jgi:hypothetical protein